MEWLTIFWKSKEASNIFHTKILIENNGYERRFVSNYSHAFILFVFCVKIIEYSFHSIQLHWPIATFKVHSELIYELKKPNIAIKHRTTDTNYIGIDTNTYTMSTVFWHNDTQSETPTTTSYDFEYIDISIQTKAINLFFFIILFVSSLPLCVLGEFVVFCSGRSVSVENEFYLCNHS